MSDPLQFAASTGLAPAGLLAARALADPDQTASVPSTPVQAGEQARVADRQPPADANPDALLAAGNRPDRTPAETRAIVDAFRRQLAGNAETIAQTPQMAPAELAARNEFQRSGELALVNIDVYRDVSDPALLPAGYRALSDSEAQRQFPTFDARHDASGFYSRVYFDSNRNTYVVVNRGTDDAHAVSGILRGTPDGRTNRALGFGQKTQQADIAVLNAEAVTAQLRGGQQVHFSGHSLGGALASLQALSGRGTATVFNPLGISSSNFANYGSQQGAMTGEVRAYVVAGDPVDAANRHLGMVRTGDQVNLASRDLSWSANEGLQSTAGARDTHGLVAVLGGLLTRAREGIN